MGFRLAILLVGSGLVIFFVFLAFKGKKYEPYVESLDDGNYPLKDLYVVGFGVAALKPFVLRGRLKLNLIEQAQKLFGQQYAEYYANVAWAQSITFCFLFLCVSFCAVGLLGPSMNLLLAVGIGISGYVGYFWLTKMRNDLNIRKDECDSELPEVVSTLALLINSGMTLNDAWEIIAYGKEGTVYDLMRTACVDMKNGVSAQDAIYKFGMISNSAEIKKFTSSLSQGLQKGSSEISHFLISQSSEMWMTKKQTMLQKGEIAASKMLLPISLIFLGTLVIIISAALGGALL